MRRGTMPSACGWVIPKQLATLSTEVRRAMSRSLQRAHKVLGEPTVAVCPFGALTFLDVQSPPFPRHIAFEHPATDDLELARALDCPVWQVRTAGNGVHVLEWAADGTLTREWNEQETAALAKASGIDFAKLPKRQKGVTIFELEPDATLSREGEIEGKRKAIRSWEALMRGGQDGGEGPTMIAKLKAELSALENG